MTTTILIIDDHPLMSAALAGVLTGLRPRTECHLAHTGAVARQLLVRHKRVDLIVLDLMLPDTDGFELLAHVREQYPGTPVLVVSASDIAEDMRRAIAAGAMGYVGKSAAPELLLKAANMAVRGEVYLPPMAQWAGTPVQNTALAPDSLLLNTRQLDVLRLVCAGRSNKFIAYELGLAEKTVKGRITAIFKLLDVDNRTQALLKATKLGLFALEPFTGDADADPGQKPSP
jgi:two-component system, NarL family, nitrate/nitrite response regulator NarL